MERDSAAEGSSVVRPLLWFAAAGLVVVLAIGFAASAIIRRNARHEAIRNAKEITLLAGRGIAEPAVSPAMLRGEPSAVARFDRAVGARVVRDPVVRAKLWTLDGHIAWSDEPRLIGRRFGLGDDERRAIRRKTVEAEVSNLDKPENRFERSSGKLLEVYLPIRAPDGTPLLFEDYLRYGSVTASESRLLRRFAPALIAALLLLWAAQLPLAWSLARRLRARQAEREVLLERALDASDTERRRIAQDVHDGLLQDLAGASLSLAATGERLEREGEPRAAAAVREGSGTMRKAIRQLRAVLVGISPQRLDRSGLPAVLDDLTSPLADRGVAVNIDLPADLDLPKRAEELLFRGAQEALRNTAKHAGASRVDVRVGREDGLAVLTVSDDGRGFDPAGQPNGHLGLRLLADLAADRGGEVSVESSAGAGTRVRVEVPIA
jgi:signal transduction histidine kinase